MSRAFFGLHRGSIILRYWFNLVLLHIFYYITPVYNKILLQFSNLQKNIISTECLSILGAVLRRAAHLSKGFSTARPSTPRKRFYTSIWAVLDKNVLSRLNTARRHNINIANIWNVLLNKEIQLAENCSASQHKCKLRKY